MSLLIRVPAQDITAILADVLAVKSKTDGLPASPADQATSMAIKGKTDNLPGDPASNTQVNTRAAQATADAIKAKTDNLPGDPTSETGAIARKFPFMDFWSAPEDKLTVTATAADITFPDIAVAGLPAGLTVKKVALIFTCRAIKDTSGADNKVNAAGKTLRVKKSTGTWGVDDVVGITFDQNSLYCAASTKEAGPTIIGATDIKSEVDGNATYNVMSNQTQRSDAIVALGNNLELYDLQVGLRIFYA